MSTQPPSQKGPFRAVLGLFLAVFWLYRTGPGGTPTGCRPFSHPREPRVTFNTNLKVTRAQARNIPRLRPVICPAGAQHPAGIRQGHGDNLQKKYAGYPTWDPGGSLWGPDLACRAPGRCSAGAFTISKRVPVGTLVRMLV